MNNLIQMKPRYVQNIINKFCYSIGMIPTSYKIALTYEEQILAIGQYLETTVYPAINNNAEALQELQDLYLELKNYVDNYFNNLNVQNEINQKLDDMAENGTLADIINQEIFQELDTKIDNNTQQLDNKINNNFSLLKTINYNNSIYSYAWRGLTSEAPENSLPAIIKAGKYNCYGVELDIQTTSDNEIVLMHDLTVDRMTNGTGVVNELTYAYISSLTIDTGAYYDSFTGICSQVPRFDDIIYIIRMYNLHILIDLKGTWSDTNLQKLIDLLEKNNLLDFTTIQSYNSDYIYKIRQLNSSIKLCFIIENTPNEGNIQFIKDMKPSALNIAFLGGDYVLNENIRLDLIRNNVEFGFSVINELADVRKLCRYNSGVTFLISKYGIPRGQNNQINKTLEAYITSEGNIVPRHTVEKNDNTIALGYSGFTASLNTSNNSYNFLYDTPMFSRFNEYNGVVIPANILAPNNFANSGKYKCVTSNVSDTGFNLRIIDTENNEVVTAEDVYTDLGNCRIQILCSGDMI